MSGLLEKLTGWFDEKTKKTPSPIEKQIEIETTRLKEQISLLRLSNSELTQTSKDLRFSVMQDLIDDIARKK